MISVGDGFKKTLPQILKSAHDPKKTFSKVGQAVYDILKRDQVQTSVEEVLSEAEKKYTQEMEDIIQSNFNKYDSPFYIIVLTKKEPWALNVMRNWFIARQTRPKVQFLRQEFPNHMSTVYSVNKSTHELKILWSLPIKQDADVVLKNRHLYDPTLVKWIEDCNSGALDHEGP